MYKIVISFAFVLISTFAMSQNFAATFLKFEGEGTVTVGKTSQSLKFPMMFNSGDKISITKGEATILLATGAEKTVKAGSEYIIPKMKKEEMIVELNPAVFQDYNVEAQSNSSVSVRADSAKLILFPISGTVIDKNSATIIWKLKGNIKVKPTIVFSEVNTMEPIFEIANIESNEISLKDVPLKAGIEYTWSFVITESNTEQTGLISLISSKQKAELQNFTCTTPTDYIKAYLFYKKNGYNFNAFATIGEAHKKYPEIKLFENLYKKMKGE